MKEASVLPYENIPFMHWGIISKYNFSMDKIRYVPRKRWDPLTSVEIKLFNEISREFVPIGKRRGHFSYISPVRGLRPSPIKKEKKAIDVFKNIIDGKDYAIFISTENKRLDSPFSTRPIMMEINNANAVTIINRFPAMVRGIDSETESLIKKKVERDPFTKVAYGINLVAFPINYSETLSEIRYEDLIALIKTLITGIAYSVDEARNKGFTLIPVYPFFNIGYLAGGSQPRLHAQVYIDLNMDGHGAFMENILQSYEEQKKIGICHLCTSRHDNRTVYENNTWIVWATSSPRRNFHLRLATKRHVQRITEIDSREIEGLADALIVSSKALDALGISGDRNIVFYSNPFGYKSYFHIFIDILPFERLGGIELLDSTRVARFAPEDVAEEIRKAIKQYEISSASK